MRRFKKTGWGAEGLNFLVYFWEIFYEKVDVSQALVLKCVNYAVRHGAGKASPHTSLFIIGACKSVCACTHAKQNCYRAVFIATHCLKSSLQ